MSVGALCQIDGQLRIPVVRRALTNAVRRGDQMRTMAEVLLERETVEGPAVDALLDGTWDQYVAEHPEEGGKPKTAPGQIDEDLVAEAAAAAAERESQ